MKKLYVTMFAFVCLTAMLFPQSSSEKSGSKFTLDVLGGLNVPRLSGGNNNEMSRDFTSRLGEAFGLTATLDLESNFSLRVDALYSSEGGKRNGIQAIEASSFYPQTPAGSYLYANYHNECILNYAEIPVMVKYSLPADKSLKLFVDFGPYIGILLNAKQKTSGSSNIYVDRAETIQVYPAQSFDANTDVTNSINPVNFGLTGGIGCTQRVCFGEILLDVRGAYGLTLVQKYTQNGSNHIGNLLIDLGYSIPF
jgi:hypothetical protein